MGVQKIVEFGFGQVEVDPSVIDALKRKMTDSKVYALEKSLNPGQLVEIKGGPLMGLEAVFMREMSGRQRAMVLLHIRTLHARVVLGVNHIAPSAAA
jgi:transcription antitermination factor NusG